MPRSSKLIVFCKLWTHIGFYYVHNGQKHQAKRLAEARDFAERNGYEGIRIVFR